VFGMVRAYARDGAHTLFWPCVISDRAMGLISGLLLPSAAARMAFAEADMARHEFFSSVRWPSLATRRERCPAAVAKGLQHTLHGMASQAPSAGDEDPEYEALENRMDGLWKAQNGDPRLLSMLKMRKEDEDAQKNSRHKEDIVRRLAKTDTTYSSDDRPTFDPLVEALSTPPVRGARHSPPVRRGTPSRRGGDADIEAHVARRSTPSRQGRDAVDRMSSPARRGTPSRRGGDADVEAELKAVERKEQLRREREAARRREEQEELEEAMGGLPQW